VTDQVSALQITLSFINIDHDSVNQTLKPEEKLKRLELIISDKADVWAKVLGIATHCIQFD